jgi:hypothetical protein
MLDCNASNVANFLRAHGVPCIVFGADVLAFGEYVQTFSEEARKRPENWHVWGYDVEIIRTMKEARVFCGY